MNFIYLYTTDSPKRFMYHYKVMSQGLVNKGHNVNSILVNNITNNTYISDTMNNISNYDCVILYGWLTTIVNYIKPRKIPALTLYDPPIRQPSNSRNYEGYRGLCWGQPHEHYYYEDTLGDVRWKRVSNKMNIKLRDWCINKNGNVLIGVRRELNFDGLDPMHDMNNLISVCDKVSKNVVLCSRTKSSHKFDLKTWPKHKIVLKTIKRLNTARCLITTGGTMVPKSIIAGVPCYYVDRTIADPLSITKNLRLFLSKPETPDRTKWLNWAAYQQWTIDEIRSGDALDYLFHIKPKIYDFS